MTYIIWAILTPVVLAIFPPAGLISLIALCISLAIRNRKLRAQRVFQQAQKIEHELDDIEASLDTITLNEKVTPIWEVPTKKR